MTKSLEQSGRVFSAVLERGSCNCRTFHAQLETVQGNGRGGGDRQIEAEGALYPLPEEFSVAHRLDLLANAVSALHAFHQATSTLVADLIQMMVALDPQALSDLRDHEWKQSHRAFAFRNADAIQLAHLHVLRFEAIDAALARAGRHFEPPEVVRLDAERQRRSAGR